MSNLAKEMERNIEPEVYLAPELRRSETKTVPVGGGRTADSLLEWTSFSLDVLEYWDGVRNQLADIPVQPYLFPVRANPPEGGAIISDEAEVRGACMTSIFGIVNLASRILGLGIQINATSSRWEAKSAVDYAGFLVDDNGSAVAVAIPIEIKGPWQFMLENFISVCELFESSDKKLILNALSQIYYYMIVEEVQYGVLCSKEQHVFFRRSSDPTDKTLYLSKTVNFGDTNPSVRQCYLYWASKAKDGDTVSASQVPSTFPSQKWVRVPTKDGAKGRDGARGRGGARGRRHAGRTVGGRTNATCRPARTVTSSRCEHAVKIDWLLSLQEMDLEQLHLGKVLKHGDKCIVREGNIMGIDVCVKVFEFFETYDHLPQFKTEVEVYKHLLPLQGLQIPRVVSYGTVWHHCVGYLALKKEGDSLKFSDPLLFQQCWHHLEKALTKIHDYNVLHNDISLENVVLSMPYHALYPIKILDFGNSIIFASEEDIAHELKQVESLCRQSKREQTIHESSNKLRCFDFDVNRD